MIVVFEDPFSNRQASVVKTNLFLSHEFLFFLLAQLYDMAHHHLCRKRNL